MAALSPTENLQEETTCSVCLEYFKDPVIAACGHNFCRSCITQCWKGLDKNFPCPQCRDTSQQKILIPNWQLANMTEITQQLLQKKMRKPGTIFCQKHNEALKLFCEEDEKPICVVCGLSRDHKAHAMCPVEEAEQEYKAKLQQCLSQLTSQLRDIQTQQLNEALKIGKIKTQVNVQRMVITMEFEELRRLLHEEEQVFLTRLKEEELEVQHKLNANISQLKEQSSSLEKQIAEIKEKCRQPATDFLNGVKTILSRSGSMTFPQSEVVHCELRKTSSEFLRQNFALNNIKKKLKVSMVAVTLDAETANPYLIISNDRKFARWGFKEQVLLRNPKRFDAYPCVLGCDGFSFGRHYWEVRVRNGKNWSIGVAKESVSRKGVATEHRQKNETGHWDHNSTNVCAKTASEIELKDGAKDWLLQPRRFSAVADAKLGGGTRALHQPINLNRCQASVNYISPKRKPPQKGDMVESPERGIWVLEQWNGQYRALSNPVTPLTLQKRPQKLAVYLDYGGRRLSFYDADTTEHLYTFTASFTEKVFPYFCIWNEETIDVY
ncbi:E3 ubiquitin-protein ligase TRIM39 [Microcaecilia unicolor]|uniref:E3 ubiquitin-protein ligase TRIM39-like n=1 Tax=Microcaecilia unicolor TaxID=1415580 RepID=A0A6P7WSE6_9AMPH|nr:E3 ubiquitin-protein ligase TRIM39-like [Microcaecilia unicolor]